MDLHQNLTAALNSLKLAEEQAINLGELIEFIDQIRDAQDAVAKAIEDYTGVAV